MTFVKSTVALALAVTIAAPSSAFAFGFGLGCSDLPELARAQGALQGLTDSCDMSVAEARRVVAAYGGAAAYGGGATYGATVAEPAPPRVPRRHHRRPPPQE